MFGKAMNRIGKISRKDGLRLSLSIVLAIVVTVGSLGLFTERAFAAPETNIRFSKIDQINEAEQDKEDTEDALAEAESKIQALRGELSELKGELQYLKDLNDAQRAQYLKIAEEYAAALIAKQEALDIYLESQETLERKSAEYSERISVMFELQNKSTLEILLESDSLAGFFTNLEIVELIAESDEQIMEEMDAALCDAQLKSEYALQEALDMEAVAEQKQAELIELEGMIGKTEATLNEKEAELSKWEKKQEELEKESDRLDKEILRLQNELYAGNGSNGTPPPQGSMTWPYPGDYKIYSPYGKRFHPVYKVWRMHWGVDLGGTYGNPIVAAADGTVIKVSTPVHGQNTGGKDFGNYVVIDHGGGVSTLYAHCKWVDVSVGDEVVAGQKIARCGSTGTSTGPHLHFEVRVNGSRVNPANYIT